VGGRGVSKEKGLDEEGLSIEKGFNKRNLG